METLKKPRENLEQEIGRFRAQLAEAHQTLQAIRDGEIDLTKRKRTEQILASEQHYRVLFDRNPDGVFAVDAAGRFRLAA